jgi:hypothetical protein
LLLGGDYEGGGEGGGGGGGGGGRSKARNMALRPISVHDEMQKL